MALHQALYQFRLYTQAEPPRDVMQRAVLEVLEARETVR
jgi:shikimate 5-dehydrogenase